MVEPQLLAFAISKYASWRLLADGAASRVQNCAELGSGTHAGAGG